MKMRKVLSLVLIAAFVLMALTACGASKAPATETKTEAPAAEKKTEAPSAEKKEAAPAKKVTIAADIHGTDNEYWAQEAEGVKMFAQTLPAGSADVQVVTSGGDDAKELDNLKALIASHGSDLIVYVDPSNAPNTAAIAELCEENKVYWSSVWHLAKGLDPTKYKYYVAFSSVDGVKQGYETANAMFKEFKTPGKGKILAIQGMLGNDSAVERYEGLQKALKENPGVQLLDTQVGDWDSQKALTITETWLSKYPDVDGVWCANDGMALGAIQALKAKKLNGKVKVTGTDGVSDAIKAIEDGDMVCTEANDGYLQGGYMAALAYNAYTGKLDVSKMAPEKRMFYTNATFVDKKNVADFKSKFMSGKPKYDYNNFDFPISGPYKLKNK